MAVKKLHGAARRRATALLVGGALAASALGACASGGNDSADGGGAGGDAGGDEPVELDFWGWVPGLEDLVATWNEDNPNIQVSFHRMTGDDGQKVEAAVDAGSGPDIVQLSTHDLPNYVIEERVQDITDYVADEEDKYTSASWASVSFDGRVYGIPQGIGPSGMMYRKDIFEEHGVAVPTTWDEYLEAARALKAADPDLHIANIASSEFGQWVQEVSQSGGSWYGIDGDAWTVGIDGPESLEIAERWQTLLDEDLVTTELMWTPEYWAKVNNGAIATISYAAWFPSQLAENAADQAGKWRVAPMPTEPGSDAQGDSGGAANVVLRGAENPEAAAEFISWLNGSEETQEALITEGGLFLSTHSGLESPALLQENEFYGGQAINEVFAAAAENTPDTWTEGPNFGTATTALTDEFATVVAGKQTFEEALHNAQDAVVEDLEASGLTVRE
ncbi:extracellular solute-binding protein [Georgenia halophila]|uniref:Extracellular solute-binding protein n=1 Tax=Georgenia halophila TaxID=620889 RepID=A0ABP8KU81_9MICO